jgi:hypothetical protein
MTAYNVVRFRVKPGTEQQFIDAHKKARPAFKGWRGGALFGMLDSFRDTLEDLGGGLGVTDPVSGEVVASITVAKPKAKTAKKAKAKKKKKR